MAIALGLIGLVLGIIFFGAGMLLVNPTSQKIEWRSNRLAGILIGGLIVVALFSVGMFRQIILTPGDTNIVYYGGATTLISVGLLVCFFVGSNLKRSLKIASQDVQSANAKMIVCALFGLIAPFLGGVAINNQLESESKRIETLVFKVEMHSPSISLLGSKEVKALWVNGFEKPIYPQSGFVDVTYTEGQKVWIIVHKSPLFGENIYLGK